MINQRRIIYILVAVVALLLLLNVILSNTLKITETPHAKSLKVLNIEDKFEEVLKSYGISNEWIIKRKLRNINYDSVKYSYQIKFPADIPIPQFIKDLNYEFFNLPSTINSTEKRNDVTELTILSGNHCKLHSVIRYDDTLMREFSEIGFLLTNIENASELDLEFLFKQGIPFNAILPLDEDSQQLAGTIKENQTEYYIMLKEDSDKIDFELDQEYSLEKLSANVRNIISSFNSPKTFFLNDIENFSIQTKNFLRNQFEERGRNLLDIDNYISIQGEAYGDLNSLLQFHIKQVNKGEHRIFRMDYSDWLQIHETLHLFLKKGNKIIPPSKFL